MLQLAFRQVLVEKLVDKAGRNRCQGVGLLWAVYGLKGLRWG